MAKEELLEFEGTVTELLPNATFRVKLDKITKSSPTPLARCARTASACWPATG